MMFGAFGNPDHDDAVKIIHKALDAGINFIDTADGYSAGESEQILGQALAGGRRESAVLAVKFGPPFDQDPNHRGASRRWITEAVEGSLRRLQTDGINLPADVLDRIDEIVPPESPSTSPTTCGTSARRRWTPHTAAARAATQGTSRSAAGTSSSASSAHSEGLL